MSSAGFLVRFLLGLTATLGAVWLAVGGATSQPHGAVLGAGQERGSWASPAELAWLERLGTWDERLTGSLRTAAHIETTPRLARLLQNRDGKTMLIHSKALEPANACAADLARAVGPAPSRRLRPALDKFRRACMHLQRFNNAITLAILQGEDYELHDAQQEAQDGSAVLAQADQMLPPGEVRILPVIAGETGQSRVEPRFGRVASVLAGKPVEVRCWSKLDWLHLIREEQAYTHGKLGSDTLGFAGIGGNRVNLGPDVCASLAKFAYGGARPLDEDGRLLMAAAVVTLSHEPQHSKGIAQEAQAECNAIQVAQRTAVKLGASRAYAQSLVRAYWGRYPEELPAYRSAGCRRGGALDLGYADSIWP